MFSLCSWAPCSTGQSWVEGDVRCCWVSRGGQRLGNRCWEGGGVQFLGAHAEAGRCGSCALGGKVERAGGRDEGTTPAQKTPHCSPVALTGLAQAHKQPAEERAGEGWSAALQCCFSSRCWDCPPGCPHLGGRGQQGTGQLNGQAVPALLTQPTRKAERPASGRVR